MTSNVFYTSEKMAEVLCLKPFAEHELDVLLTLPSRLVTQTKQQVAKDLYRRTGRTTRIVLQALCRVSQGRPVAFSAPRYEQRRNMTSMARAYATKLGLNLALIDPGRDEDARDITVYNDHP